MPPAVAPAINEWSGFSFFTTMMKVCREGGLSTRDALGSENQGPPTVWRERRGDRRFGTKGIRSYIPRRGHFYLAPLLMASRPT